MMDRHQRTKYGSAVGCKHRLQNRIMTSCALCGALRSRPGAPWTYLTEEWQRYYDNGGERPKG